MEWVQEPTALARPGMLGQSDSGYDATYTLIGWALFGLAVYGLVVLIRKA